MNLIPSVTWRRTGMNSFRKKVLLVILLLVLILVFYLSGFGDYFTFQQLRTYRDQLKLFVADHYFASVVGFLLIYIATTGLALPCGPVLAMTGGFVFGVFQTAFLVDIAATCGATILFLLSRYLVGDWVQKRYHIKLGTFNRQVEENGTFYLLTLRLAPMVPFTWINLFSGLTRIRISTYIWTTAVGILPGTLAFAFTGSQLGMINSPGDLLSIGVWVSFLILSIFAFFPVIIKRIRKTKFR